MKKELNTYDYYYEPSTQPTMMVANGHAGFHTVHPYNLEDEFLHILGKNHNNLNYCHNATNVRDACKNQQFVFVYANIKINTEFPSPDYKTVGFKILSPISL